MCGLGPILRAKVTDKNNFWPGSMMANGGDDDHTVTIHDTFSDHCLAVILSKLTEFLTLTLDQTLRLTLTITLK